MNRLTRFHKEGLLVNEGGYYEPDKSNYMDITNKLGKIEDLEDEIGCPLEVVVEALKDGILVNHKKWWLPSCQLAYMKIDNEYVFVCESYIYILKDYGKTWWLNSDRR